MTSSSPVAPVASTQQARERLRAVRDRATDWLLERVADDGRPAFADEHLGHYRFPWALAHVGEREAAAAVLGWHERHVLTDGGDLRDGVNRAGWTTGAATYPLAIIASGAWALERYGTASAIMDTLSSRFQDAATGGAFWERPEARTTGYQMSFTTAQLGLTALATGRRDVADGAFAWFERLWAAQPSLPARLYPMWGPGGLVTEFPDAVRFNAVVDFTLDDPVQTFHNPGIAAAFLARYGGATGSSSALTTASAYLELNENGTAAQFDHTASTSICKFGWGSAVLHEVAPSVRLVRNVCRMADWYADSQRPDGSWVHRTPSRPNPTEAHVMEKTVEHLLWVSMMLGGLALHPDPAAPEETA